MLNRRAVQVTPGDTDNHKPSVCNTVVRTRTVAQHSVLGYYVTEEE